MAILWNHALEPVWPCLPEGGLGAFMRSLVQSCNQHLQTGTPVRKIILDDGLAKGILTDDGPMDDAAVICATTADVVLELAPNLPDRIRESLGRVTYSKCCRIFFGLDASPLPRNWYAIGFPRTIGTFITGTSNAAVLVPETVPLGKALLDAIAIDHAAQELFPLSDEEIVRRTLSEYLKYFPGMGSATLFTRVIRWPRALGLPPGGAMTSLARLNEEEFKGSARLFFAGDFMGIPSANAALQSGLDAAGAVADLLC